MGRETSVAHILLSPCVFWEGRRLLCVFSDLLRVCVVGGRGYHIIFLEPLTPSVSNNKPRMVSHCPCASTKALFVTIYSTFYLKSLLDILTGNSVYVLQKNCLF